MNGGDFSRSIERLRSQLLLRDKRRDELKAELIKRGPDIDLIKVILLELLESP